MNNNKAVWMFLVVSILLILSVGVMAQISVSGFNAAAGTLFNFSPATTFRVEAGTGATAGATGAELEDTTATMYHNFTGGVDSQVGTWPTSATITQGDCMIWGKVGGLITLQDLGSPCTYTGGIAKAQAVNTAVQVIAAATATALTFNVNSYDPYSVHSTSVNPTRFTIPTLQAGAWMFGCQTEMPLLMATTTYLQYYVNGSPTVFTSSNATNATYPTYPHLEWILNLNVGDYVECFTFIEGALGATLPANGSAMVATKL